MAKEEQAPIDTIEERPKKIWGWRNRLLIWINTIIMILIFTGILVGINIISKKYYLRKDITTEQSYSISDETKNVLRKLDKDITIYFIRSQETSDPNLPNAWRKVTQLLEEYKARSNRVTVKEVTEESADVLKKLQNLTLNIDDILFMCGKKTKVVNMREVYRADQFTGRISYFRAEEAFTSAIKQISTDEVIKLYFTIGHNEAEWEGAKARISIFTRTLKDRENCEIYPINLLKEEKIPEDCAILFIIDPEREFSIKEQELLKNYLEKGGRLFVIVSPITECKLESFLEAWGIHIEYNLILEKTIFGPSYDLIADTYTAHPINKMEGARTILSFTCAVEPSQRRDEKALSYTLIARDKVFAITDFSPLSDPKKRIPYDPSMERTWSLATASEVMVEKEDIKKKARLVVIGSKIFLDDKIAEPFMRRLMPNYNIEYAINCYRWLLEREGDIVIPAKEFKATPLMLKPEEQKKIFWLSILAFPSIGIILGVIVWFFRRK